MLICIIHLLNGITILEGILILKCNHIYSCYGAKNLIILNVVHTHNNSILKDQDLLTDSLEFLSVNSSESGHHDHVYLPDLVHRRLSFGCESN